MQQPGKQPPAAAAQPPVPEPKREVDPVAKDHWKKGNALFEEGKFNDALLEFTESMKVDPKYADAYFNRALTYRILNNFSAAKKDLDSVMELQPKSADAPLLVGDMAEANNDLLGARFWYEKALANNPDYAEAKNRLEHIDSLIHIDSTYGKDTKTKQVAMEKYDYSETKIEEGQIKKLAFYKSNQTFANVMGMDRLKKYLRDNIILAIKEPELFKRYGKKLGLGTILYGPPGCGKCVSADTEVLLPDGRYVTIKEVVDKKEPYILTLTKMHKLGVAKVTGWWELEGKPMLRITTKRGRVLECTPEHPLLTRNGWVEASKFKEGETIGVPRSLPIFGGALMKESEVKLLAYLIAEGCMTQGQAAFTNADPQMLEDFQSCVRQLDTALHVNTRPARGGVMTMYVYGRYRGQTGPQEKSTMRQFLDQHSLSYTNSTNKKIPPVIFTLQKHLVALFLNRLFSGDGWVEYKPMPDGIYGPRTMKRVGYSSNSRTLIRQIQHLLLRFGIVSTMRKKPTAEHYEVLIMKRRDIDAFIDEIGMFGDKAEKLVKEKQVWGKIKKKGGSRVVYEEIVKIEDTGKPEKVYDLTVDETHNFVANDFYVHNTYIVNAIAGESNANVIIARVNQIVDMYTGNTEKNLHALFEQARKNPPCILFFDELDGLGVKRDSGGQGGESSALRLAVNQFLVEMNGVEENPSGIFVIGATNVPWDIDSALKRSGRFGDHIYVAPPNYWQRKSLFQYHTKNMPRGSLSWDRLARATIGYSPADIQRICDKAIMRPLLHEHDTHQSRKLNMGDMLAVLRDKEQSSSSLDEWYNMVKKEVISKTETQIVDGKKQEIIKEGKLDAEEKVIYKAMVGDIKKNTNEILIFFKKIIRWWATYIF